MVVLVEGQVVDEEDEALLPPRQAADELRHAPEPVLLHLDEPEGLKAGDGEEGLHRGRLTGAAVAVEEDIVDPLSGQEGPGVGDDLLPLEAVAHHLLLLGGVRVGHRDELPLRPQEGPVPGEEPGAVDPVEGGEVVKGEGNGALPPGQGLQHGAEGLRQQGGHGGDQDAAVQPGQPGEGLHIPAGGPLQGGVGAAPVQQGGVGGLGVAQPVPQPVPQAGLARLPQAVEDLGVVLQGVLAVSGGQGVQQGTDLEHQRLPQQVPAGGKPQQGGANFFDHGYPFLSVQRVSLSPTSGSRR